jgi:tRNA threonylcarbamoyladenosine biosynthesis protein TsaE
MQSLVTQRRLTVQAEETRALGAGLGRWAQAGDVVACRGALGAGKTTFVQGFAEGVGVGSDDYVRSPTFALVHAYHGYVPLYHFDFYRLVSCTEVQDIGIYTYC